MRWTIEARESQPIRATWLGVCAWCACAATACGSGDSANAATDTLQVVASQTQAGTFLSANTFHGGPNAALCGKPFSDESCTVYGCSVQDQGAPVGGMYVGNVTAHGSTDLAIEPGGATGSLSGQLWTPGQKVSFVGTPSATNMPAFQTDVIGPDPIVLATPTATDVQTIARSSALQLKWTSAFGGTVRLHLESDTADSIVSLECIWDASVSGASVPAKALGALPDPSSGTASLEIGNSSESSLRVGAWAIMAMAKVPDALTANVQLK